MTGKFCGPWLNWTARGSLGCDFPRSHASNEPIFWEPLFSFVPRADSGSLCSWFYSFRLLLSSLVWLATVFKRCEKCFVQKVCWRGATCRGEGSFRVKSPVSTCCYRSHHAAWNCCLLPLFKQKKKCISSECAQPSCKNGPCDVNVKLWVFTLAASLWTPCELLDTADLPDAHKHFMQVWLNGKNNSCRFRSLWSPLNHERAVDGAVSWEEIAGNVKGSSVEDSLPKWENTASLWKAEIGHIPLCVYISVVTVILEAIPFPSCSAEVYVFLVLNLSSGKCPVHFSWLSI